MNEEIVSKTLQEIERDGYCLVQNVLPPESVFNVKFSSPNLEKIVRGRPHPPSRRWEKDKHK